jgi:hypothetical protein
MVRGPDWAVNVVEDAGSPFAAWEPGGRPRAPVRLLSSASTPPPSCFSLHPLRCSLSTRMDICRSKRQYPVVSILMGDGCLRQLISACEGRRSASPGAVLYTDSARPRWT